ncbi:2,5-diketo-D-gluconate reductase B [Halorubrum aquaticum]|uniref:2,5-diketo-D-gluconate reductase B n=1 Tax=Halorubrum aquaticum TaxID=387340 RepID=A0A1I3B8L1_9EURY|nr:aldo/keto reductase [Halorubrum aquaticum]SFH58540.1 2,5-diketo-D-gluconate reductase B [Halorubrum aquaticum]
MTGDIPAPGLGTYRVTEHDDCVRSVRTALEEGYRHVDTAEAYGNEVAVGEGIAAADVDREDVFLATKVLHPKFTDDYSAASVKENAHACLDRLGVDRVDLLYAVHWPADGYDPEATFDAVADLHDEGVFDRLGVCNMTPEEIDEARDRAPVPIDALQVEMHPLLPQRRLRTYCDSHDIDLVAYAPLGNGRVLDVPELVEIGDAHGVSPARVSIAWAMEKGVVPIPKATSRDHIVDNVRARDLELSAADVERIDGIDRRDRQYDPPYAPAWSG